MVSFKISVVSFMVLIFLFSAVTMSLFESKQHFGIWHAWHLLN